MAITRDRYLTIAADLVRLSLVAGVVVALVLGQPTQSFRFVVVLAVSLGARWLRVPRPFGLALTIALAVETWGRLFGVYEAWDPFDEVIHLVLMGCLAPLVYLLLARMDLVPQLRELSSPRQLVALPLLAGMIGLAIGALWEVYEWFVVTYLDADVITAYGDAMTDLVVDVLGAILGGVLLIVWARQRWPNEYSPDLPAGGRGARD